MSVQNAFSGNVQNQQSLDNRHSINFVFINSDSNSDSSKAYELKIEMY